MAIKLRIISEQSKLLGADSSRIFGVTGGRIGRALDNDWVLPDPERYVSSHHAQVSFRAGQWMLEDVSTNGVFVNESDTALSVIGPRKLKDGDRLRLGDYDILVNIDDRNDFPPDSSGQMPRPTAHKARSKPRAASSGHLDNDLGEELDITGLFRARPSDDDEFVNIDPVNAAPVVQATVQANAPAMAAPTRQALMAQNHASEPSRFAATGSHARHFVAEEPRPLSKAAAPSLVNGAATDANHSGNWHMSTRRIDKREISGDTSRNQAIQSTAQDSHNKSTDVAESQNAFESFCRGAGIGINSLSAESQATIMTLAGQMLREVTLDLMEALKSRPDLAAPEAANSIPNPIKASASVEDVLRRLLLARGSRQLGAVDALRDAFGELRDQRTASDQASLTAINDLLKRLDPIELQERFDRGLKRTTTPQTAYKAKYWDLLVEFFPLINQRDPRNLPAVYTDEFARQYATKITELTQRRRK
jgi:type VI secretion system protein